MGRIPTLELDNFLFIGEPAKAKQYLPQAKLWNIAVHMSTLWRAGHN
jgi:hypothetical protein